MNNNIIEIKNLNKYFPGANKADGALSNFLTFFTKKSKKKKHVIKNISFSLEPGENLGIIGANGSGKSTLLRLIAGIYTPSSGEILKPDYVLYMSGFGLGLKPKLSVLKNIELVGILMGLSKKQIKSKMKEIINYSELFNLENEAVFKLSSGMLNRLKFSITINFLVYKKPQLLLLDEVFGSGGDYSFRQKASKEMEKLMKSGLSIIFVSHDLNIIKKYCPKSILLEKGQILEIANSDKLINKYKQSKL